MKEFIINEKIRASEVQLTGINGEKIGVFSRDEALAMAKKLKVDLVCTSLLSSPPPCQLIAKSAAKQNIQQAKRETDKEQHPLKIKEIRLTAQIEEHDYETKVNQARKLLASGHAVQLVVKLQAKEGKEAAALLENVLKDLDTAGKKASGIQLSGKQAVVQVNPVCV